MNRKNKLHGACTERSYCAVVIANLDKPSEPKVNLRLAIGTLIFCQRNIVHQQEQLFFLVETKSTLPKRYRFSHIFGSFSVSPPPKLRVWLPSSIVRYYIISMTLSCFHPSLSAFPEWTHRFYPHPWPSNFQEHLEYCSSLLFGLPHKSLPQLQLVQNFCLYLYHNFYYILLRPFRNSSPGQIPSRIQNPSAHIQGYLQPYPLQICQIFFISSCSASSCSSWCQLPLSVQIPIDEIRDILFLG